MRRGTRAPLHAAPTSARGSSRGRKVRVGPVEFKLNCCLAVCRQLRQSKPGVYRTRRPALCVDDRSTCSGGGSHSNLKLVRHTATTTASCRNCPDRRTADCSGPACRRVVNNKRRINDVMSQCIQAYCTDVLYHVRVACILRHCNRSRRAVAADSK